MPIQFGDECGVCEQSFVLFEDEDGSAYSDRTEYRCACGELLGCQHCIDDQIEADKASKCAHGDCKRLVCEKCGGSDRDGDRYCTEHMPRPLLDAALLERAA